MASFELYGGTEAAFGVLRKMEMFLRAASLGGPSSLAAHPATMTHASMPKEHRENCGITDGLIRLSVGLENINDIIADLSRALETS